jgi:hypothetical protein
MIPVVVNKYKSEYDVYIGRGSIWGNPFPINESTGDTREVVIEKYREYIYAKIERSEITLDDLRSLEGKRLACFCAPKACHGDVLVEIVKTLLEM